MSLQVLGAEQGLRQRHRIGGMAGRLRRCLTALIRIAEEGVLHVEVPLVRRDLHRLAHATAREVHRRRHVGELDEVHEIFEGSVTASAVEVADERRSAHRREDGGVTAETHVALGVAGEEREFRGRGRQQPACHAQGI